MLFPCAEEGNLRDLWKLFAPTTTKPLAGLLLPQWCSSAWLLKECIGLADGLAHIHGHGLDGHSGGFLHADIKPENILAFSTPNPTSPVHLKFADFGDSLALDSKGQVNKLFIAHTMTYRPPEKDLENEMATASWDVWCLGCVYLEFITWFLLGCNGLDDFQEERTREQDDKRTHKAKGEVFEDTFFRKLLIVSWIPIPSQQISAKVKKSVLNVCLDNKSLL